MNKLKLAISVLIFATMTISLYGQKKSIDNFKVNKNKVDVYFYDPFEVLLKTENFASMSDKEKSDLLSNYLHNNPLYLFVVTNKKTKDITYLCIRGNPEKTETKMFYKVEIIKGISNSDFNPNTENYSDKIVKEIDQVNCGGTLFENMNLFSKPEDKKYIGNGIQLFGYFRRVQPYNEIKDSMKIIIERL